MEYQIKRDHYAMVISVLVILTMPVFVSAIGPQLVQPQYWSEFVGYQEGRWGIPIFVLYDPPGDGSYASLTKQKSVALGFKLSLLSGPAYLAIDQDVSTEITMGYTCQTSNSIENDHSVVCEYFYQRYELWDIITPRGVYRKLILVESISLNEWSHYRFGNLPDNVTVYDKTGTVGKYHSHRDIPHGVHDSETIELYTDIYVAIGAGIKVNIAGLAFELIVQGVFTTTNKLSVTYNYYDSSEDLSFYVNSNADYVDFPFVEDITYWFS